MQISRVLGSWPAIIAVPVLCAAAVYVGFPQLALTYILSVAALTFTQLVLREQNKDSAIDKQIQIEQLQVEKRIEKEVRDNA